MAQKILEFIDEDKENIDPQFTNRCKDVPSMQKFKYDSKESQLNLFVTPFKDSSLTNMRREPFKPVSVKLIR